jgi:hypothetical protein
MNIKGFLDRILHAYSEGVYYDQVKRAKEEFFSKAGRVAEGSENFDAQMDAFLDWYLFDRPLDKVEICPVKMFVVEHAEKLPADELKIFQGMTKSRHSLFELLKVRNNDVYVKDLFDSEKYIVEESEINKGFTKGDIFEGRLIHFGDRLVFGSSFVFHPREVKSFISKEIKKIKYLDDKQHLKLLHRLATMRLKVEQYPHIAVEHIYTESPLF